MVERGSWKMTPIEEIKGSKELSLVEWINSNLIVTADLDNQVKVFDFKQRKLLYWVQCYQPILQVNYCN